jgi:hypothetical protein
MDIGNLLQRSWNVFWKNKVIWVFGVVAAFAGGSDYSVSFRFNVSRPAQPGEAVLPPQLRDFLTSPALPVIILVLVVVFLLIGLVFFLVNRLAHGAMIGMADEADRTGSTSLGSGWRTGRGKALRLFLIGILLNLPVLILVIPAVAIFLASFLPMILAAQGGRGPARPEALISGMLGAFGCFCSAICLAVILGLILRLLDRFAIRACVLEDLGVVASIKRGWRVATGSLGYTVLLWFAFGIIGLIVGGVLAIPMAALALPVMLSFMESGRFGAQQIVLILGMLAYGLIAGVVVGGILTSFNATVWTLAYRAFADKLTAQTPAPAADTST